MFAKQWHTQCFLDSFPHPGPSLCLGSRIASILCTSVALTSSGEINPYYFMTFKGNSESSSKNATEEIQDTSRRFRKMCGDVMGAKGRARLLVLRLDPSDTCGWGERPEKEEEGDGGRGGLREPKAETPQWHSPPPHTSVGRAWSCDPV